MKPENKNDKLKSALRDNLKKRKQQSRRFKQGEGEKTPTMKLRDRDLSTDR